MERMSLEYKGNLSVEATHERSGAKIITDAPVDNQGLGRSFSPSDLMCTAAAACMLTIMGISANAHGFPFEGVKVGVEKEMNENPRRVKTIRVEIDLSMHSYTPKQRKIIEAAAQSCPVMLSLHPEVEKIITYKYE